jgi:carbon storage regulator
MLVLSRKVGEAIIIDDHIRIVVVEVKGNQVRLGLTAPPDIRIDRQEIHERRSSKWSFTSESLQRVLV